MKRYIIALILALSSNIQLLLAYSNGTLWPGKTIRLEVSATQGYLHPSWSVSDPTVKLSGSGFYRDVKADAYFGGTCVITCSYDYYVGSKKYQNKTSWEYNCADNTLTLSPTKVNMRVGKTQNLSWKFAWATYMTPTMQFTGYDSSIIDVSSSGVITAKKEGTTTIYAKSNLGSNSATCIVNVSENAVSPTNTTITIPSTLSFEVGESYTFLPDITTEGDNYTVTWVSDNLDVVSIDNSGIATGKSVGTATITAQMNGGEVEAYCMVNVTNNKKFELKASPVSGTVEKGTTVTLSAGLSGAVIYYTTDGSYPMDNPTLYSEPITIETPMLINALAYHKDYGISELLTESYDVTSLKVISYEPTLGINDVSIDAMPKITFNEDIVEADISLATMHNTSTDENVMFDYVIDGTTLTIVPDERLALGKYEITLPEYSVVNQNGEPNKLVNYTFSVISDGKESYSQMYWPFRLMDNGNLYVWGYDFPDDMLTKGYRESIDEHLALQGVKQIYTPEQDVFSEPYRQYYYIDDDDNLYGWGKVYTELGETNPIGNGSTNDVSNPVKILSDVKDFKNGKYHKGALCNNGKLYMWGSGYMIGDGEYSGIRTSPVAVLSNVKSFDVGQLHSIAITNDNKLYAWGYGYSIGKDNYSGIESPIQISSKVIKTCTGLTHCLFIDEDKKLYACGQNYPCVGVSSAFGKKYISPTQILSNVEKCYAGAYESLAIKTNGDLYQWGYATSSTSYLLGNTPSLALQDVKDVEVAGSTVYALKNDGTVWTRGENGLGQLGQGHSNTSSDYYKTFYSTGLENVEKIWGNSEQCFALKSDGSLWGWGSWLPNVGSSNKPILIREAQGVMSAVAFSEDKVEIECGQKRILELNMTPSTASYESIEWESSDENVVTVSARGVVNGIAAGTATIIAKVKTDMGFSFKASCTVSVSEPSGIANITYTKPQNNNVYDLQGRIIKGKPLKGIYIINGKKVFVQ